MNISRKQIVDELVKIESTLPDEFVYDGIDYWPVLRLKIAFSSIESKYVRTNRKESSLAKLTRAIKAFFVIRLPRLEQYDALFVTSRNYQIKVGVNYYDRVLEPYKRDVLASHGFYLTLDTSDGSIGINGNNGSVYNISAILLRAKLVARLDILIGRRLGKVSPGIKNLMKRREDYPVLFASTSEDSLLFEVLYIRALTRYFKKFLEKINLKTVYHGVGYDPIGLALNSAACSIGNIATHTVQHGGQSRNNPAFGQWTKIREQGYAFFSNIYLCWDKGSSDTVEEWAKKSINHCTRIDGYRWADLWSSGAIDDSESKSMLVNANKFSVNVLVTLQPSIYGIPDVVKYLIQQTESCVGWWIRLHPRQKGGEMENIIRGECGNRDNVFLEEATNTSLMTLLTRMSLHITGYSSSAYEAAHFGILTIFVSELAQGYFDELIDSKKAILMNNPSKILDVIHSRSELDTPH